MSKVSHAGKPAGRPAGELAQAPNALIFSFTWAPPSSARSTRISQQPVIHGILRERFIHLMHIVRLGRSIGSNWSHAWRDGVIVFISAIPSCAAVDAGAAGGCGGTGRPACHRSLRPGVLCNVQGGQHTAGGAAGGTRMAMATSGYRASCPQGTGSACAMLHHAGPHEAQGSK
jgi:hypothetical protein